MGDTLYSPCEFSRLSAVRDRLRVCERWAPFVGRLRLGNGVGGERASWEGGLVEAWMMRGLRWRVVEPM